MACAELSSIEEHHPASDNGEVVLQLKVVEDRTLRHDVFQKGPQGRDVPLPVSQLVDEPVLSLFGGHLKRLIEATPGAAYPQSRVKHQEPLADSVHDVLGIRLDVLAY